MHIIDPISAGTLIVVLVKNQEEHDSARHDGRSWTGTSALRSERRPVSDARAEIPGLMLRLGRVTIPIPGPKKFLPQCKML